MMFNIQCWTTSDRMEGAKAHSALVIKMMLDNAEDLGRVLKKSKGYDLSFHRPHQSYLSHSVPEAHYWLCAVCLKRSNHIAVYGALLPPYLMAFLLLFFLNDYNDLAWLSLWRCCCAIRRSLGRSHLVTCGRRQQIRTHHLNNTCGQCWTTQETKTKTKTKKR